MQGSQLWPHSQVSGAAWPTTKNRCKKQPLHGNSAEPCGAFHAACPPAVAEQVLRATDVAAQNIADAASVMPFPAAEAAIANGMVKCHQLLLLLLLASPPSFCTWRLVYLMLTVGSAGAAAATSQSLFLNLLMSSCSTLSFCFSNECCISCCRS